MQHLTLSFREWKEVKLTSWFHKVHPQVTVEVTRVFSLFTFLRFGRFLMSIGDDNGRESLRDAPFIPFCATTPATNPFKNNWHQFICFYFPSQWKNKIFYAMTFLLRNGTVVAAPPSQLLEVRFLNFRWNLFPMQHVHASLDLLQKTFTLFHALRQTVSNFITYRAQ